MASGQIRKGGMILLTAGSLLGASPASASDKSWDQASNVARDGLILFALGVPVANGDGRGIKEAAFSLAATQAVTSGLKGVIHEERPDGSDDNSFPSGHTSISFASAATLEKRYGWQVGIPAHVVAAFVGLARAEARKHYLHDVLVGAAIGETAGWLITSKRNSKVQWLPWGDAHGGGASVAIRF